MRTDRGISVPIVPLLALAAAGPDTRGRKPSILYACAAVGFVMALMATRVSYLEDQAMRRDVNGRLMLNYYEQVNPAPGRPSNRYRLEHVPFVTAMKTPGWSESQNLGQGPDYFYKHLRQARRQLPDGQSIPENLPFLWQSTWIVIALGAATHLAVQVPTEWPPQVGRLRPSRSQQVRTAGLTRHHKHHGCSWQSSDVFR